MRTAAVTTGKASIRTKKYCGADDDAKLDGSKDDDAIRDDDEPVCPDGTAAAATRIVISADDGTYGADAAKDSAAVAAGSED